MRNADRTSSRGQDPDIKAGLQWGIGCLVGGAAIGGILILVLLVSIFAQPPVWLQIVLGVALAAGGTLFAWLITSALRRSEQTKLERGGPVSLPDSRVSEERRPPNE